MPFFRLLLAAAIACLAQPALSCSYSPPDTFHRSFSRANSIFVFRLETLALTDTGSNEVIGRIRVVETFKGKQPRFKFIRFRTARCGGIRLDVGHYFVGLTRENGQMLSLGAGDRSVLDLRDQYDEEASDKYNKNGSLLRTIRSAIASGVLPDTFPTNYDLQFTQYNEPPPAIGKER